ncbi:hypothetical protein Pst134EA_032016 [Puccinia striiformis f. sp. tritici]|uniref:uncharacterized protein n=1 Tax=Puccinia striiformis f. sp. tritici TaxID=168172 RepID=UPI002007E6DC|nr:uncharacterized protein Pst134EA_032016 [Puccinia striiformis f. sp. tritici]KAH9444379.1 hypothetical protein Pst134EA_032016 [Puccinia striiformis f. sp. tritici]KAH9451319.1 hypothetical protein Pst134EB_018796 [Puccinia striiformis f. sp. tritici]
MNLLETGGSRFKSTVLHQWDQLWDYSVSIFLDFSHFPFSSRILPTQLKPEKSQKAEFKLHQESHSVPCPQDMEKTTTHRKIKFIQMSAIHSVLSFLLGIGDRHPYNILVSLNTLEIVHIDFGICFGQGKLSKTPELVPFRLTDDFKLLENHIPLSRM